MKQFISFLLILVLTTFSFGQTKDLSSMEDELVILLGNLRKAEGDQAKVTANKLFKEKIAEVIQHKEALIYPFAKMETVGIIDSPDKQMRIINWNVEKDDYSHTYNCFVLHFDKRKKKYFTTELIDNSFGMPSHPTEIISSTNWYGALYYKIIPVKKGSKTLYTVLGWDHNSTMSQVKLIDVIYFTGKTLKLGSPIFKEGKTTKKRVFFEHSKKTSMSLKYESDRDRIIFDHLSPESPSMKKFRSFYVPDMSYDAYVLEANKWILVEDVIGVNKSDGEKKQTVHVLNEKTGKVEEKEMKTDWENPSDPNNPNGSTEHVAVTPEQNGETKSNDEPKLKVNKKDKRDPSNVSFQDQVVNKKKKKWRKRRRRN